MKLAIAILALAAASTVHAQGCNTPPPTLNTYVGLTNTSSFDPQPIPCEPCVSFLDGLEFFGKWVWVGGVSLFLIYQGVMLSEFRVRDAESRNAINRLSRQLFYTRKTVKALKRAQGRSDE
jgi:hypothetical protein